MRGSGDCQPGWLNVIQSIALVYDFGNELCAAEALTSVPYGSLLASGKLIKIGAKAVIQARYVIFQMAEVAVPRELFAAILDRIQRFGFLPPLVQRG